MKVDEFILVADPDKRAFLAYENEDLVLLKKYRSFLIHTFSDVVFPFGFWKVTVKSKFFGIYKQGTMEKLSMPL